MKNDSISGDLVSKWGTHFQQYSISGIYRSSDSTVYINEDSGIAHNVAGYRAFRDYDLKIIAEGNRLKLYGVTRNYAGLPFASAVGKAEFVRIVPEDTVVQAVKRVKEKTPDRNITLVKTIQVQKGTVVQIEISDNARIDNDIVSVSINGEKVISHKALTHTPLIYNINTATFKGNIDIAMHAESTGSMPPCTATMKLSTADTSYNIELASDYQSNGAIRIVLRK